jgi:hypothetical protein
MRWVVLLVLMDRFVRVLPAADTIRYGVEAKIRRLQEILGVSGREADFSKLLRKHGYDENLALDAYLLNDDFPQAEAPWARSPRAGASLEPDRDHHASNPSKRLRAASTFTPMYPDEPAEPEPAGPDVVPPETRASEDEPYMAPAEPHVAGPSSGNTTAGDGGFWLMQSLNRISSRIDALHLDLPRALRQYDADALASQKEAAREAALGNETHVIDRARTMADFELLEGFRYNASENVIICANCTRFSPNSPGILLTYPNR